MIVIIGPSGSGKSTLLRCINRLEVPDEGTIIIDGIEQRNNETLMNKMRAEVGMVFQQFNLFPHMTALENITLGPVIARGWEKERAEILAHELLAKVGIPRKS